MKLFIVFTLLFSFNLFADTTGIGKQIRDSKHANNEVMQGVYSISTPSTTTATSSTVSVDPFWSKTNKYAESRLIRVVCLAQACHIKFGDSSISAANNADYLIPANSPEYFGVDSSYPYVRMIQAAATSSMFVTEIY